MIDAISSTLSTNPRSQQIAEQGQRDGATMQMDDFLQLLPPRLQTRIPWNP